MEKISIIIPVYNVENYIDKCIQSLFEQTYSNFEIILIDDGSTDKSPILCDEYAKKDNRVKVFHKENGGVSSARNLGLEKSTGDYIAFVDPDDWVEKDMIFFIMEDFKQNNVDAVFYGYDEVSSNSKNKKYPIIHSPEKTGVDDDRQAIYQMMIGIGKGYYTIIANKAFKRSIYKDNNFLFDKEIAVGEDSVWLVEMVKKCNRVYFDNRVFYHWLQREESASNSKNISPKRLTAIKAQQINCENLIEYGDEIVEIAKGKLYNDCFFLQIIAYSEKNKSVEKYIKQQIEMGKKSFFANNEFSKVRKIKVVLCSLMMKFKFSGKYINSLMDITTYDIKKKIKRGN